MDIKRTLIFSVLAAVLTIGWLQALNFVRSRYPGLASQPTTTASTSPATQPAVSAGAAPTSGPTTQNGVTAGLHVLATDVAPAAMKIGSDKPQDTTYALQLQLTPLGAGLDSVILNDFYETVERKRLYGFEHPLSGLEGASRALATRSIIIDGQAVDVSNAFWTPRLGASAAAAAFELTIADGDKPILKVIKSYNLPARSDASRGFEVAVDHQFENLTDRPLNVKATFGGPLTPTNETNRNEPQVLSAYWDEGIIQLYHDGVSAFKDAKATRDLTQNSEKQRLVWSGFSSDYFNAIVLPEARAANELPGSWIEKTTAAGVGAADPSTGHGLQNVLFTMETTALTVPASQSAAFPKLSVYLGPKWRAILNQDHYSQLPRHYNSTLVPVNRGPCGICTFNWLINVMVWLLGAFHFLLGGFAGHGDWGLAIVCLVVIVRACLHPITKRSQVQMTKMGGLSKEAQALKEKYGDNKEELNKAMMQLYKQQGFTPVLGCLPMFLQMPIWIALYAVLQSTFELRHAPLLWGLTWIDDLAQPDHLILFRQPLNFYFFTLEAINLLPVLLAVVFFLQQKYTPKPPATTPEQEQQQKMMQWMTLLFPIFLYKLPSGLNLYILTSTSIGIIEARIVRKHIKEREEAEKAGKIIVDASPTRGSRRRGEKEAPEVVKKGGLAGWFANLQERAEQLRREQNRGGSGGSGGGGGGRR